MNIIDSLIIKKCIVGTLPLGLTGSGTNKFSSLPLENYSTGRSTTPSDCIINDIDYASGMEWEV